jgi:hypothetical protein
MSLCLLQPPNAQPPAGIRKECQRLSPVTLLIYSEGCGAAKTASGNSSGGRAWLREDAYTYSKTIQPELYSRFLPAGNFRRRQVNECSFCAAVSLCAESGSSLNTGNNHKSERYDMQRPLPFSIDTTLWRAARPAERPGNTLSVSALALLSSEQQREGLSSVAK